MRSTLKPPRAYGNPASQTAASQGKPRRTGTNPTSGVPTAERRRKTTPSLMHPMDHGTIEAWMTGRARLSVEATPGSTGAADVKQTTVDTTACRVCYDDPDLSQPLRMRPRVDSATRLRPIPEARTHPQWRPPSQNTVGAQDERGSCAEVLKLTLAGSTAEDHPVSRLARWGVKVPSLKGWAANKPNWLRANPWGPLKQLSASKNGR